MKKYLQIISNKAGKTLKSNSPFKLNILLLLLFTMFTLFMLASGYFSIGLLSDDYLNIISANTSSLSEKFTGDVPYYSKHHFRPIWFLSIQSTHAITNSLGLANDNFLIYRIENLFLLFAFTFIASRLIYRITGRAAPSVLLAVLILIIPNNLNSICWTIGKVDFMAGIFILGTIYFSTKYLQDKSKVWLIISVVMLVLGLLTKETAVITPFVCYLILKYSDTGEEGSRRTLLFNQSAILVLYLLFRIFFASGNFSDAITTYSDPTLSGRLIVAIQAFISLLFPFDYLSLQNELAHFDLLLISYIVIIVSLCISLIHAIWKKKLSGLLLSSVLIFFISIIPNLTAGYFRPQLILIPFSLTLLSLILFVSKSDFRFGITGGILAVVIIYWLLIDYKLIRNWSYANIKSEEAISKLLNSPEETFENAVVLGLPGRIKQAHMTEYATGPYNYFRFGAGPVKINVKDAVHVSALDTGSLISELTVERSGENEYYVYSTGATQYFQITGQRENEIGTNSFQITLDSLNSFRKPRRLKIKTADKSIGIYLYNSQKLVKISE